MYIKHEKGKSESIRIDLIIYSKGSLCVKATHISRFELCTLHTNCLRIDNTFFSFTFWSNLHNCYMFSLLHIFHQIPQVQKPYFRPIRESKETTQIILPNTHTFLGSAKPMHQNQERKKFDSNCFWYCCLGKWEHFFLLAWVQRSFYFIDNINYVKEKLFQLNNIQYYWGKSPNQMGSYENVRVSH